MPDIALTTDRGTLTKRDIAAIRQADYLSVKHADGETSVTLTKRAAISDAQPFAQDIDYSLDALVTLGCYARGADISSARAFAYVSLYKFDKGPIALLRAGDVVRFTIRADNNNQVMTAVGLHLDELVLHLTRGTLTVDMVLSHVISPNNSARMVRGIRYDSDRELRQA